MGPLHIEMALINTIGDWLDDSGWTMLLARANITRSGVAESLLTGSKVKRSRYAHKVTACVLYMLQKRAFAKCIGIDNCSFEDWVQKIEEKNPSFKYWSITWICTVITRRKL